MRTQSAADVTTISRLALTQPYDTAVPPAGRAWGEVLWQMTGIYHAFDDEPLFEDASLTVHRGETLAIIGESGSGKSVWLKMMLGLIVPDQGQIVFKGQDLSTMTDVQLEEARQSVGYLFQAGALFDSMTVHDNVAYALYEHTELPGERIRERVVECLEMVGLAARIVDQYPASLSGGMRKRVALARAIAIEPEVVLYDEPTQGLDPQNITRISNMIESLRDRLSISSVLVTHDMRCAFGVCDRIALLHEGKFPFVASPRWFLESDDAPVREFIDDARQDLEEVGIVAKLSAR
jgi:phospholipid/cholesterol/gamma-HCH transport system ATP-binding protein